MSLTPETLVKHELIGLRVEVVDAANLDLIGIRGRIVNETMRTLHVESDEDDRVRTVPKPGTTFEFVVPTAVSDRDSDRAEQRNRDHDYTATPPDGTAVTRVTVVGDRLVARPARRTETTGVSKWQSD